MYLSFEHIGDYIYTHYPISEIAIFDTHCESLIMSFKINCHLGKLSGGVICNMARQLPCRKIDFPIIKKPVLFCFILGYRPRATPI